MKNKISLSEPLIQKEDIKEVVKTLKSGWVSTAGNNIGIFEKKYPVSQNQNMWWHVIQVHQGYMLLLLLLV